MIVRGRPEADGAHAGGGARTFPLTRVELAVRATQVCSRFPRAHGAPIHFGDPAAIGIRDVSKPDYGDPSEIRAGEVPVFWACGVTPQAVIVAAKPSFAITHAPGRVLVTDLQNTQLAEHERREALS